MSTTITTTPEDPKQVLATAVRMLERARIIDFNGHASIRLAGSDLLLINAGRSSRNSLTAADIVTIDLEGNLVEGSDPPPMEFHLHTAIYRRRPDVGAVIHAHPTWSTLLTIAGVPVKPVIPQAAVLGPIPLYPRAYSINTRERGQQVAETLGDARTTLLRSHGAITVGADIVQAFVLAVYLEENAQRQYMASQIGKAASLDDEELEEMERNLWKPHLLTKVWDYYRSQLPPA